jgi:hypothetical protein
VQGTAVPPAGNLGLSRARLLQGGLGGDGDERIELRIQRSDTVELRSSQLDG